MNRISRHVQQVRTIACTSTTALTRKHMLYIPRKTKEEMMALHEEDAQRWNGTTLSKRFGAPIENVHGLLKLYALRKQREKQIEQREDEERQRIEQARERMLQSWSELAEFMMRSRHIADASSFVKQQDGEDEEGEEVGEEVQEELEKSKWAAFLEEHIESAALDSSRKCTYAFVEIGSTHDKVTRAVWIREGNSGQLRLADQAERALLLNQVRARDSEAFRSSKQQ